MFVSYIEKSRDYYAAQGFTTAYRWAAYPDVPFADLRKPVAEARIGLVTTAGLMDSDHAHDRAFDWHSVYAAPIDPPPARLFTDNRFWDKAATHTDDLDSFAPIHRLQEFAAAGRIGSLSPRFYGIPTEYSQRKTNETDSPALLECCREDEVDAAILVAL